MMKKLFEIVGMLCVTVPAIFGMFIASIAWRAWWLYPAWGWFIVPLGVPPIRFWHFAALLTLTDAFRKIDAKKDDRKVEWGIVVAGFFWPIVVWVILRWMR